MAYTLQRFGAITLPLYNRRTDMSPVVPRTALVATAAGAFDAWGSERAPQKLPHNITMLCLLSEDAAATYRTAIDALRAAVGTRAALYRVADDDDSLHRCTARLIDMDYQRSVANKRHQELKLTFQQLDAWAGKRHEDWELDDGSLFDDALFLDTGAVALPMDATTTIDLAGNLPVLDATLSLIAYGGPSIQVWYIDVLSPARCAIYTWISNPTSASEVVLACGTKTCLADGAENYARFSYDVDHANDNWIELRPGANQVRVEREYAAYGSTAKLAYAERWA